MLTKKMKETVVADWKLNPASLGSADAQIGLLTARIKQIAIHLKSNHKDHSSRLGLVKLVGSRRRFLKYLERRDRSRFVTISSLVKSSK